MQGPIGVLLHRHRLLHPPLLELVGGDGGIDRIVSASASTGLTNPICLGKLLGQFVIPELPCVGKLLVVLDRLSPVLVLLVLSGDLLVYPSLPLVELSSCTGIGALVQVVLLPCIVSGNALKDAANG